MRSDNAGVAALADRLPDALLETATVQIATIVAIAPDGSPEVRLRPDGLQVPARLAVPATLERIEAAIADGQQTVVLFEDGDRRKPIVLGFIETIAPHVQTRPADAESMPCVEADVDGRRVRVTAQDEIVLQCGKASITLRRNGRVIVRGTYVESRSDGTNRIKGGQVQIN